MKSSTPRPNLLPFSTFVQRYFNLGRAVSVETVENHFNGVALAENSALHNFSDCLICGNVVQQIQDETVKDYLDKTVVLGETLAETEARRRAFLDGMLAGTFLLVPGGVSQATACDGNWYSFAYNHYYALPGSILID